MVDGPEALLQPAIVARVLLARAASLLPFQSGSKTAVHAAVAAGETQRGSGDCGKSNGASTAALRQLLGMA